MIKITFLLKSFLKFKLKKQSIEMELPEGSTAMDALRRLVEDCADREITQYAFSKKGDCHLLFVLNKLSVTGDAPLRDGDELSCVPSLAGG